MQGNPTPAVRAGQTNKPSKEELEALYPKHSLAAIGKMKRATHSTVRKWCCEYGIPIRRHRSRLILPPSKEELQTLYPKHSTTTIGKMKNVTHMTVRKWIRGYGMAMEPIGARRGKLTRPDIETGTIVAMMEKGLKSAQIAKQLDTTLALVIYRQKLAKATAAEQVVFDLRAQAEADKRKLAETLAKLATAEARAAKAKADRSESRRKSYTPEEVTAAIQLARKMPSVAHSTAMRALNISESEFYRWIDQGKLKKYKKGFVYSAHVLQVLDRGLSERKL